MRPQLNVTKTGELKWRRVPLRMEAALWAAGAAREGEPSSAHAL